jgi:hypothetical protein
VDTAAISRIALAGTARLTDTLASNGGSYLTRRRDEQKQILRHAQFAIKMEIYTGLVRGGGESHGWMDHEAGLLECQYAEGCWRGRRLPLSWAGGPPGARTLNPQIKSLLLYR